MLHVGFEPHGAFITLCTKKTSGCGLPHPGVTPIQFAILVAYLKSKKLMASLNFFYFRESLSHLFFGIYSIFTLHEGSAGRVFY